VLDNRDLWREAVSHTFHGRDLFAPVAARLADGTPIEAVGTRLDPADLVHLAFPEPTLRDGGLDTSVLFVDAFGNCRLAGQPADLEALRGRLEPGQRFLVRIGEAAFDVTWQSTFGAVEPGMPLLYEDADYAGLAIGVNLGSAGERFGLDNDTPVRIEPA
ncbi:MAG: SAM hydrolase/SAM-dependent halogenase family protein, partial [Candidatus Limnocylindria bacterium]